MDVILLTGFEPFGGEKVNPSGGLALSLDGAEIASGGVKVRVRSILLPVTWEGAFDRLVEALGEQQPGPAAVVMLGQAAGYPGLGIERVAVNVCSGKDNDGVERAEQPAVPDGPPAYFSTLPLQAVVRRVESVGLPSSISNSAGTYLCNYVFYRLMHHLSGEPAPPRAGFIHVPYLPEQAVGKRPVPPSMAAADIERGVKAALAAVAQSLAE